MSRDAVRRVLAAFPVIHDSCRQRALLTADGRSRVSAHQATVLAQLDRPQGITLTELATRMGTALPTMSLLVDRLSRAGLAERARDPEDGRRVLIRLTSAGRRLLADRSLLDPDRVRALLAALSPEERTRSVEGLVALAQAARRLPPIPSKPSQARGGV